MLCQSTGLFAVFQFYIILSNILVAISSSSLNDLTTQLLLVQVIKDGWHHSRDINYIAFIKVQLTGRSWLPKKSIGEWVWNTSHSTSRYHVKDNTANMISDIEIIIDIHSCIIDASILYKWDVVTTKRLENIEEENTYRYGKLAFTYIFMSYKRNTTH